MRILHIGDLHYRIKNEFEQNKISLKFIEELKKIDPVDFVFFSGDLVNAGNSNKDFEKAHKYLFDPILKIFNLSQNELFICEGNHDIDRSKIVNAIITEFAIKSTVDSQYIQTWYDKQKNDRETSLHPSSNFFNYLKNLERNDKDIVEELFTIHKREINGKSIGVVTLNSAWFSADRNDEKELLFLPSIIENAITKVRDCSLRILMQHHPLNFYKDPVSLQIQDLIHSNFHLLLTGHEHHEGVGTNIKFNNGICYNKTKASICYDGEIGFAIIETDETILDSFKIERYHYVKEDNSFSNLETLRIPIPTTEQKYQENQLRKKIFAKYNDELRQANLLLLEFNETDRNGFLDTFTDPVLTKKPEEQSAISESEFRVSVKSLETATSSFLIFGKDKCGKTSLLKKIFLNFLHDYGENEKIPLFLDYKSLEAEMDKFDLKKLIISYYSLNRTQSQKIIDNGDIFLLFDNLDTASPLHSQVVDFLSAHRQIKFIACSEYLTSRIYTEELDSLEYEKIYFKKLGRSEIRDYTTKLQTIKAEDRDEIVDKVSNFCKQLELPVNFWTVSLILLIYKKATDDYSKNLFSILDSCVDEMLQKKKLLFERNSLKFEQYKTLCSQIAFSLYDKFKSDEYATTDTELINIIQEYIDKNQRIIIGSFEIFSFLVESGIFKKKFDGKYTFRLNGIFEYFLAYYIKENDTFKDQLLKSDSIYLQFKNELEIYSGFNRSDLNFLRAIFEKTKKALLEYHVSYEGNIDKILNDKIGVAYDFEKEIKKLLLSESLTDTEKDKSFDKKEEGEINSDVHVKNEISINSLNLENVEKYLTILSRVLKNSDAVTDSKLIIEIFNYLLDSYCFYGFYLIDEYKKMAEEMILRSNLNEEEKDFVFGEEILNLLSRIVPVLSQVMLYDGIGHVNFSRIINDKIKELRIEANKNQYKLFVLYFLLMDIDLKSNKNLVEDIFEEITLAPLKVSTLFKLNFYLGFKTQKNSPLEQFFKNKVQEADLRLDKKNTPASLQEHLASTTKRKFIKK